MQGSRGVAVQGSRGAGVHGRKGEIDVDRIICGLLISLILFITSIPSIYALAITPRGAMWSGLIARNTNDINGYLSIIEEVRADGLLAHNLMTAEPHPAFQLRPIHALLGIFGKLFPELTPVAILELGRIITTTFFLIVVLCVIFRLFRSTPNKIFAFLIIVFGSGLGWLHFINDPPDLRYSELSTLCSLISAPLYQFSLGCVLLIVLSLSNAVQSETRKIRFKQSMIAAVSAVLLGLERPFSLVTLSFAVLGFVIIEVITKKKLLKVLSVIIPFGIGTVAVVLFQFYLIHSIPVYAEWNRQNILPSPPLIAILVSLGLLIPLAAFGFPDALIRHRALALILFCYAISSVVCSKLPVGVQERFLEGLPLSTAILAAVGAVRIRNKIKMRDLRAIFPIVLIAILIPSNLIVMRDDVRKLSHRMVPQFMPLSFIDGLEVLKQFSKPGEPLFSMELAGNFAIAYSVRPAVISHRIGTAHMNEKKGIVTGLLEMNSESPEAKALIKKSLAKWLFWGPEERDYAAGRFDPKKASFLKEVFRNKMVAIYRIQFN